MTEPLMSSWNSLGQQVTAWSLCSADYNWQALGDCYHPAKGLSQQTLEMFDVITPLPQLYWDAILSVSVCLDSILLLNIRVLLNVLHDPSYRFHMMNLISPFCSTDLAACCPSIEHTTSTMSENCILCQLAWAAQTGFFSISEQRLSESWNSFHMGYLPTLIGPGLPVHRGYGHDRDHPEMVYWNDRRIFWRTSFFSWRFLCDSDEVVGTLFLTPDRIWDPKSWTEQILEKGKGWEGDGLNCSCNCLLLTKHFLNWFLQRLLQY